MLNSMIKLKMEGAVSTDLPGAICRGQLGAILWGRMGAVYVKFPALISLKETEREILTALPFENNRTVMIEDIKKAYDALLKKGNSKEQAKKALYFIDPFDHFPEIIEKISELWFL